MFQRRFVIHPCLHCSPYQKLCLRVAVLFLRSKLVVQKDTLTPSLLHCSPLRCIHFTATFSPPCNVSSLAISTIELSVSFALLQNGCVIVINISLLCCTQNYPYLLLLITYIVYLLPFETYDFPLLTTAELEHVPHFFHRIVVLLCGQVTVVC
jgi:hypothetical protein